MQGYGWAHTREKVHLAGIAEFLFRGRRRRGLNELSETGAGIRETPGWKLDATCLKRGEDIFTGGSVHANLSKDWKITIVSLAAAMVLFGNSVVSQYEMQLAPIEGDKGHMQDIGNEQDQTITRSEVKTC
jgi:hypothetical protein